MNKAESARALVESRGFGCLSTNSIRHPGFPFVSIAEYATDAAGCPLFLLSGLAVHTKNLLSDPRASLIVFAEDAERDALGSARVTLMGELRKAEDADVRDLYLARHPAAAQWVGFGDFGFYRLDVADVYYVGGFGEMGWIGGGVYSF